MEEGEEEDLDACHDLASPEPVTASSSNGDVADIPELEAVSLLQETASSESHQADNRDRYTSRAYRAPEQYIP